MTIQLISGPVNEYLINSNYIVKGDFAAISTVTRFCFGNDQNIIWNGMSMAAGAREFFISFDQIDRHSVTCLLLSDSSATWTAVQQRSTGSARAL